MNSRLDSVEAGSAKFLAEREVNVAGEGDLNRVGPCRFNHSRQGNNARNTRQLQDHTHDHWTFLPIRPWPPVEASIGVLDARDESNRTKVPLSALADVVVLGRHRAIA
jgi:hypothetical protein